ncbi:Hypothetical protein AT6N2_L1949 [Agrobacterium tumefaciens]|nr:Hypothetical protein AT6N2_L1949 [Agrobacterium tumefaciens]
MVFLISEGALRTGSMTTVMRQRTTCLLVMARKQEASRSVQPTHSEMGIDERRVLNKIA